MKDKETLEKLNKSELIAEKKVCEERLANFTDPTKDHAYNFFYYMPKNLMEKNLAMITELIEDS